MAESVLDIIRERFPEAAGLAADRIFARGRNIFFDSVSKQLLPQFTERSDLIFAALFLAKISVAEAGAELQLTDGTVLARAKGVFIVVDEKLLALAGLTQPES